MGSWGEGLFIFRELGSTGDYFRGAGEQAYTFGDYVGTAEKVKKKKSGIWGDQIIIFRDQGSTDPPVGASELLSFVFIQDQLFILIRVERVQLSI